LLLLFTVLPVFSSSGLIYLILQLQDQLQQLTFTGWLGIFILASFPIAASLIPNTLAGLLAGFFLGWAGLAGMCLSFSLACIWGFFLGKIAGKNLIQDVVKIWPKLSGLISGFREKPVSLAWGLRLLPAPPFAISSLILAWLDVPFRQYFPASIAGMLPRITAVVFVGSVAKNLKELLSDKSSDPMLLASLFMAAALGFFWLYLRFGRKKKRA
jgi:uncharacterized membrane protein YdjX (TVP38/TMEM64 family)